MIKTQFAGSAAILLCVFAHATSYAAEVSAGVSAIDRDIQKLSSDSFNERSAGLRDLQAALGSQVGAMLQVDDPETQGKLRELMLFNEGLMRWAESVTTASFEDRKAAVAFATQPDVLPNLGLAFEREGDARADALRALATHKDHAVDDILAQMIADPEPILYVTAMDLARQRPATKEVTNALWFRAVDAGFAIHERNATKQERIFFKGKNIGQEHLDARLFAQGTDADMAVEVLQGLDCTDLLPKVMDRLREAEQHISSSGSPNRLVIYSQTYAPMQNVYLVAQHIQSKMIFSVLYRIATGNRGFVAIQRQPDQSMFDLSSRGIAIVTFAKLLNENPTTWGAVAVTTTAGGWGFKDAAAEQQAVDRIKEWGKTHPEVSAGEKSVKAAWNEPAFTQPREQ